MACVFAVGCQSRATSDVGVVEYKITETKDALAIVALGAAHEVLGQVSLTYGTFTIPDDGRVADGVDLLVEVGSQHAEHVSAGHNELMLPLVGTEGSAINAFLTAPEVSAALARWHVRFDLADTIGFAMDEPAALASGTERAYVGSCLNGGSGTSSPYTGCGACTYASSGACGETDCKQYTIGGGVYGEFVVCGASQNMVQRKCTFSNDPANPCGVAGPGGCAVCWNHDNRSDNGCPIGFLTTNLATECKWVGAKVSNPI